MSSQPIMSKHMLSRAYLEQVYVRDMNRESARMALSLSPPEEAPPPRERREPRQQAKDPARARKADKSENQGSKTQKATATLGSKSAKRKAQSLAGGMSALGSALAMAGFKGRAQLDKEAETESKATGSAGEITDKHEEHVIHNFGYICCLNSTS